MRSIKRNRETTDKQISTHRVGKRSNRRALRRRVGAGSHHVERLEHRLLLSAAAADVWIGGKWSGTLTDQIGDLKTYPCTVQIGQDGTPIRPGPDVSVSINAGPNLWAGVYVGQLTGTQATLSESDGGCCIGMEITASADGNSISGTNVQVEYGDTVQSTFQITRLLPDLTGTFDSTSLPADRLVAPGETIDPSLTVTSANASASGIMSIAYYLSPDESPNDAVFSMTVGNQAVNLATGGSAAYGNSFALDFDPTFKPGKYYLLAQIDSDAGVPESDTTNDVVVGPQLQVGLFDTSPLVLQGSYTADHVNHRFNFQGPINVEIKNGSHTTPLLAATNAWQTATKVDLSGNITSLAGPASGSAIVQGSLLLNGELQFTSPNFAAAKVTSQTAGFSMGGLPVALTDLMLSASSSSGYPIEMWGSVTLPQTTLFTGATIQFNQDDPLHVSSQGLGVDNLPKLDVNTLYLDDTLPLISTGGFGLTYDTASDAFNVQGSYATLWLKNAEIPLGIGAVKLTFGGAKLVGSIVLPPIDLGDGFEITDGTLTVDESTNSVQIGGDVELPMLGFAVKAELGLNSGNFDAVSLGAEFTTPVHIPGTFFELDEIKATIDHCASSDPAPVTVSGKFTLIVGNSVVHIPASVANLFASGETNVAPVYVVVTLSGSSSLVVTGQTEVAILGGESQLNGVFGVVVMNGSATIDLHRGTLVEDGGVSVLGSVATGMWHLAIAPSGDLVASGTAQITFPSWTILGPLSGEKVSGNGLMSLPAAGGGFLAIWGTIANPLQAVPETLGLRWDVGLNLPTIIGAAPLAPPAPEAATVSTPDPVTATVAASQSFAVPPGAEYILLSALWDNATMDPAVELVDPSGHVYTNANLTSSSTAQIVPELTSANGITVTAVNPAPGVWTLQLPDTTGLGNVSFSGLENAPAATLSATETDAGGRTVQVGYDVSGDPTASVSLFVDGSAAGFSGTPVALDVAGATGNVFIDRLSLAPGTYHAYTILSTDDGIPQFAYVPGTFTVWIPGDANRDGQVNFADLLAVAQNFGAQSGASWLAGDFNFDGAVGFSDLLLLAQNYGKSDSPLSQFAAANDATVSRSASVSDEGIVASQSRRVTSSLAADLLRHLAPPGRH